MPTPEPARLEELAPYRRKRRFEDTPEPDGAKGDQTGESRRFVVHEHHARRLHWDLRLEHEGVLVSWAIPNGIPMDPKHNRKAIHVEDHPLEYLTFKGVIPAGNYGAGTVDVWDHGSYECEKWRSDEVMVNFRGQRLRGRYVLFRAGREERDWMIHRMDPPPEPGEAMPQTVEPMLAKLSTLPAVESEWAFEVKWDGVRAMLHSEPGHLRLLSRNGNEITAAYPELRPLNRALGSHSAILDGEIVALDGNGLPSFQRLQRRMHQRGEAATRRLSESTPATYMIFDLLWLDGQSLMGMPYTERRLRLEQLGLEGSHWRVPESFIGQGTQLLQATRERGLEGIIGKRLDSRYVSGRHGAWTKVKNRARQEVVIGGWTSGAGQRSGLIGALLLGVYENPGELRYVGRVGTGFDAAELARLARLFAPLALDATPFTGRQPARDSHFLAPELVCEVEFSEWTHAGTLRQPSYRGLRDDKRPEQVTRERIEPILSGDSPAGESPEAAAPGPALLKGAHKARGTVQMEVEGRHLRLTNLNKVMYPETGFTKAALIDYYVNVAPALLPHVRDRPLTLKRYPDGVQGEFFYEKRSPTHRPEWVQTAAVRSGSRNADVSYTLCQDLPTLVWLANLANIELHPSLSLADELDRPTVVVFDLDPGAPADVVACCGVALELRALFQQLGLDSLPKTSGSKGLQVYVPLNDDGASYAQTKPFAHAVAALLEQRQPDLVVSSMIRTERRGRVLIDWSQNDRHKTTVSVYSLRATGSPQVSTPVDWDEVADCRARQDPALMSFGPAEVLSRIADVGDRFWKILSLRQKLPRLEE